MEGLDSEVIHHSDCICCNKVVPGKYHHIRRTQLCDFFKYIPLLHAQQKVGADLSWHHTYLAAPR